jgi:hypothetical protein
MTAEVVGTVVAAVLGLAWCGIVGAVLLAPTPAGRRARAAELVARAEVERRAARVGQVHPVPAQLAGPFQLARPVPAAPSGRDRHMADLARSLGVDLDVMTATATRLDVHYYDGVVDRVEARFLAPCPVAEVVRTGRHVEVRYRSPLVLEHELAQRQWAGDCP